jgi:diamine N-acetyltransferase
MKITLTPVTADNWRDACKLSVREDQRGFVASNLYSIAESRFYETWSPMAVYAGDEMVGFVMWGRDDEPSEPEWWIIRLMVDHSYQGKGYGKAAALAAIEATRAEGARDVYLSFEPENTFARALYERLGFVDTGRVEGGEIVYRLSFE